MGIPSDGQYHQFPSGVTLGGVYRSRSLAPDRPISTCETGRDLLQRQIYNLIGQVCRFTHLDDDF